MRRKDIVMYQGIFGTTSYVFAVIFSSNNKFILSGSHDKTIRIWNLSSGICICVLMGHTDTVGSLSLTRDNNWLLSSNGSIYTAQSSDYNFRGWNIGRLLNGVENVSQQQIDWTKIYSDQGLRFQNCTMNGVIMSVEDNLRYIKS